MQHCAVQLHLKGLEALLLLLVALLTLATLLMTVKGEVQRGGAWRLVLCTLLYVGQAGASLLHMGRRASCCLAAAAARGCH